MKESNIEWIKKIPDNWNIKKGKYFLQNITRDVHEDDKIITCFRDGEVTLRTNRREEGFTISEKEIGYQGINEGDLVVHGMDGFAGAIGISDSNGKASPVLNVLETTENKKYLMYYLRIMAYYGVFEALSTGIRVRTCDTNWQKLKELPYILPPIDEQEKISSFLDKKCSNINNLIGKYKKEIEDLNSYKKNMVEETVLLGIDKNEEYIEKKYKWIDRVSKNVSIIPLKYILEDGKKSIKTGPFGSQLAGNDFLKEESNYWVYNQRSVIDKEFKKGNAFITEAKYKEMKSFQVKKNDILVTTRCTIGKICRINEIYNPGIIHPCIIKFRIDDSKYNYKLLEYIFNDSLLIDKQIRYKSNSTTIEVIYSDTLKNILIPDWDMETQKKMVKYLEKKCLKIDNILSIKYKQLAILEQYKKSLIYEYVTGKKEVKENNSLIQDNSNEIIINCKDNIFAQSILLCKIIEKLSKYNLGRVKAEKTLYLIEKDIGFFNNNYVREAAGPLSEAIYKCESVISKNKWIKVNKVKRHIEYEILSDFDKYNKYYEKYYSSYDNQIENIINIIKNYTTDKAEMVATLYASWNDFIIKKEEISDIKIVKDVRENWNDTKKRFKENEWLDVLKEMKQVGLIPKGKGNLTMIKEQ